MDALSDLARHVLEAKLECSAVNGQTLDDQTSPKQRIAVQPGGFTFLARVLQSKVPTEPCCDGLRWATALHDFNRALRSGFCNNVCACIRHRQRYEFTRFHRCVATRIRGIRCMRMHFTIGAATAH
jgi:hypothetical protein